MMICACAGSEMGRGGFVCVWQWLWVGGGGVESVRRGRSGGGCDWPGGP